MTQFTAYRLTRVLRAWACGTVVCWCFARPAGAFSTVANDQFDVINESHPAVPVPGSFTLGQPNADAGSITVFVQSPLPPFELIQLSESIHYTVVSVVDTFEIHVFTLPPQFVVPGVYDFLVSYSLFLTCTGDCNTDDSVTVDEIITMVNIALGNTDVSACEFGDANGDSQITVDEILTAVNNALNGCPQIAPSPTPTPTATAMPSMSVDVSGRWREDQYRLVSSDCDSDLTNSIVMAVGQPPTCDYQVSQNGSSVSGIDCSGATADGSVDSTGTVEFDLPPEQETESGCTITVSATMVIAAGHSPTSATVTLPITFSGSCDGFSNCTIVMQSRWTKL